MEEKSFVAGSDSKVADQGSAETVLGKSLQKARQAKGLTQQQLCQKAGLSYSTLAKIATISDKKITLQNTVDPSIIGGFILRIGDKQYNAAVSNRLQELRREFLN